MKILIGTSDLRRIEQIRSSFRGNLIFVSNYLIFQEKIQDTYDHIWVHSDLFQTVYPWVWLDLIRRHNPDTPLSVVLSDLVYDSILNDVIVRLAGDYRFHVIPLGQSERDLIRGLEQILLGRTNELDRKKQGKIVSIMSASSKDGATTIAINLALQLAKDEKLRIALFDLNLWSPDIKDHLNIVTLGKDLLSIRPKCIPNMLTSSDLIAHCFQKKEWKNLYLLLGTHRRDTAVDVNTENMQALLDTAKECFDIIICDVNTVPNNAATVYTVRHADERWVVSQPLYSSYTSSWGDWYECFWKHSGLKSSDFSLVLNRSDSVSVKVHTVESKMKMTCIGEIRNIPGGKGLQAVNDGVPYILVEEQEEKPFTKDISHLADTLLKKWGYAEISLDIVPKKSWFPFLKKAKA